MIYKPATLPSGEPVLELKSLTVFLAVAETGSMTAAGRRLNLSQPAVSQAMARLEAKIGAHLFERDTRPLRLTPAGEMLRDGGPMLLEAEEALRRSACCMGALIRMIWCRLHYPANRLRARFI